MKQLINVLTEEILSQVKLLKSNIIRVESIDNPIIYMNICKNLQSSTRIDQLIPKLTREKYQELKSATNASWTQALNYLFQGDNVYYDVNPTSEYLELSYVDFNNAITKWRNESANLDSSKTSLVLLLGTEAAPDTGGLADTSFVISPREILAELVTDYSKWFNGVLVANSIDSQDCRKAIHTLYRAVFSSVNTDLFKLSCFIDGMKEIHFSSAQELISYICETLNTVWGIPSVIDKRAVPKVQSLSKEKLSNAKIILDAIKFINRADDIPSQSAIDKLREKFDRYAKEKDVDLTCAFPEEGSIFENYAAFKYCVIDFLCGKELDSNRRQLLQIDYAIINNIIGTKLPKGTSEKAPVIIGEPVKAYAEMFLRTISQFYSAYSSYPASIAVCVDRVSLSDCTDDQKEDSYMQICNFVGGILDFFNDASIEISGHLLNFSYNTVDSNDPFNYANYDDIKNKVKSTGKWGDPCKIIFTHIASDGVNIHNYDYKWAFSPYSPWLNSFSYLENVLFRSGDSYILPTLVVCQNIQDYLGCESEDEFYAQLNQFQDRVLFDELRKEIRTYFSTTETAAQFDNVCNCFKNFALQMTQHGLFTALDHLRKLVQAYTKLMENIYDYYDHFTDIQREKLPLLINSFVITSNPSVISNCDMAEVILPAYNPVILEKIDAKQLFLRDGFAELVASKISYNTTDDKLLAKLQSLVQLSSITHGVDTIHKKAASYLTCQNMWEYFGVYYEFASNEDLVSGNSFGMSIVTDDEDASAMLRATPMSNIIVRNVLDYVRTFPSRMDGLNIAFIAPTDMQHIVAAIHVIAREFDDNNTSATINIKLICLNSKKNSATYLRRWIDSYFADERAVKVNTYLCNISIRSKSDIDDLGALLQNFDLCFNYNILDSVGVEFGQTAKETFDKDQAKFPMTFTPDAIPATHGKSRRVNISQFQFIASKCQTQAGYINGYPNSIKGIYRAYKTLELRDIKEAIIEVSHIYCKWVVCIDPAIDRHMLEAKNSKIIGFTTGEGSYGELNVTVSARNDILVDIKQMLRRRITEKFTNWDSNRFKKASDYCVDVISRYMDGSRILKALNPYDYEIHSFLAYILTLQMLGLTQNNDKFIVRALISLDSYKHWFAEDDELSKDNKRPDFMLIEIPNTIENLEIDAKLHINIKIIECKMGFRSDTHISKAIMQIEKGLRTMITNWDPYNTGVMHRYWLNQLYRAIIFSPINMDNSKPEYNVVRDKIYGILNGHYELQWTGDIFAFWLDVNNETPDEWPIDSPVLSELQAKGVDLHPIICHSYGQMFIQKMLLPPEERASAFIYNNVTIEEATCSENELEEDESVRESMKELDSESVVSEEPTGESIPKTKDVYIPFIIHLDDKQEHTRQSSLAWYRSFFKITDMDCTISYESNGHPKWETIFDFAITNFRRDRLLENSQTGSFHITERGHKIAQMALPSWNADDFANAVELIKNSISPENDQPSVEETVQNVVVAASEKHTESMQNSGEAVTEKTGDLITQEVQESAKYPLSSVRLLLGKDLRTNEKYYWEFGNKELNNRHLLINGNSGCGKTYCIQALLMEAALQGVSSVVFDYTGGFTSGKLDRIFKSALESKIQQRVIRISKIPVNPFAKHEIQIDEDLFVPEDDVDIASKIAEIFSTVYSLGDQQKSAVYSAVLNGIKKHGESMSFSAMAEELEEIGSSYAKTVISKIQAFTDINPFMEEEHFNWSDIRDSDGMVYVIQLAGYGRDIQILLTELLLWDIWSFCVKTGDETKPFVLVLDEAQNLNHGDKSPSAKILTEGRKFGISGWFATQFMKPQLSDDEIQRLQQAGQKLYFCPPDDGVMTVAKNIDITTQGAKDWSERLKKLKKGECVTCGNIIRNGLFSKYEPRIVKVTSLQERLHND